MRCASQRGFTLIEMLVSVTLMALIGVAIADSLRFARRSLQSVANSERGSWEMVATQRFLRHALESAEPSMSGSVLESAVSLRGTETQLTFDAAGLRAMDEGVASVFDIRLANGRDRKSLVVRWHPQTFDDDLASDTLDETEVLLSDVQSVRWRYLPRDTGGSSATRDDPWLDEWQGRSDLPAFVRLDVTFPSGSRRVWPPLIIQLRLTNDAGCVFDVVAQDCRRSS
jgi:general secretion pathway protein J